jgi:Family of unknown function (DUF6152)
MNQVINTESIMRNKAKIIGLVVVGLLAAPAPVPAHHGGASFDDTRTVTVAGTVTDYIWANPHVYVKLDAKDDTGKIVHWVVEGQNPISMNAIGWRKDTFKVGDVVSIDVYQAKNGSPVGSTGSSGPTAPRHRIIINGKQFQ